VVDEVTVVRLPRDRLLMRDWLDASQSRHTVHGLFEVDVTEARRRLGDTSFTAFIIHCFAEALAAEPTLNSARRGRRLYRFHTVNVGTMVEVEEGGTKRLAGIVVHDAGRVGVPEIHRQIRAAQRRSASDLAGAAGMKPLLAMPRVARRALLRFMLARPRWAHRMGLLTGVTAIGMFGPGAGWGVPLSVGAAATCSLTVGGIARRPVLIDGNIENHEFVCLTLSIDHDLVDGAPAARFATALGRLIERADGLAAPYTVGAA
jgi:pyruvate/2-oxoglutarate dehydrogenase complex dihydrolipoamide acyltransferase (E2) component